MKTPTPTKTNWSTISSGNMLKDISAGKALAAELREYVKNTQDYSQIVRTLWDMPLVPNYLSNAFVHEITKNDGSRLAMVSSRVVMSMNDIYRELRLSGGVA